MTRYLAGCVAATLVVVSVADAAPASIASVGWLQGCWRDATESRVIEEHWMAPLGDSMVGLGRTVRAGRLAEFEAVVIRETSSGLAYEAHPSGQPRATFPVKSAAARSIVFENPGHDFPQRIGYEQQDPSTLRAWIEGARQGAVRRVEFRYTRVACS